MNEALNPPEFARSVVFPKAFLEGIFSHESLLSFQRKGKSTEADHSISVAHCDVLATEEAIHLYGCRVAARANERISNTETQRCHYLGFYRFTFTDDLQKAGYYNVSAPHVPEHGEESHFEITLSVARPPPEQGKKEALRDCRMDFISLLFARLFGPQRHVCECDIERRDWVMRMPLPTLPPTQVAVNQ